MIPFQLHRRIPLIRRPFWQRDRACQEAQELRDRAAEHDAMIARLKTQVAELKSKSRTSVVPDLDANEFDRLPDAESFYEFIVRYAITCIRENDFADNFDEGRFGTDRSRMFLANSLAPNYVWLGRSYGQLFEAFRTLEDSQSRLLFASLLIYRLVVHLGFKIPVAFRNRQANLDSYTKIEEAGRTNSALAGPDRIRKNASRVTKTSAARNRSFIASPYEHDQPPDARATRCRAAHRRTATSAAPLAHPSNHRPSGHRPSGPWCATA
jgi:hypothetical protein